MKLATGQIGGRVRVLASSVADHIVDLSEASGEPGLTMRSVIELSSAARAELFAAAEPSTAATTVDSSMITWSPPLLDPSKIVGVALNNDVFNYLAVRTMTAPMYFLTPPSAMTGHGGPIEVDPAWGVVHPEPELAAVIGTPLRRATPAEALAGVFGYTIINDITSPGLKSDDSVELAMPEGITVDEPWRTMHGENDRSLYLTYHARSKGTDTFAPMGPWIVTPDDLGDPDNLGIRSYLDEELVLEDSTANLTFPIAEVLAHLSHTMTLSPGDIVHFGTAARPAQPERFATIRAIDLTRHGETVSIEIDGIGRLDNHIRRLSVV